MTGNGGIAAHPPPPTPHQEGSPATPPWGSQQHLFPFGLLGSMFWTLRGWPQPRYCSEAHLGRGSSIPRFNVMPCHASERDTVNQMSMLNKNKTGDN